MNRIKPDAIDVEVGARVRVRREQLSMPQSALSEQFGIRTEQLEDCEHGLDRLDARWLYRAPEIRDVAAMFFFRNRSDDVLPCKERLMNFRLDEHDKAILQNAFSGIKDKRLRRRIATSVQALRSWPSEPEIER